MAKLRTHLSACWQSFPRVLLGLLLLCAPTLACRPRIKTWHQAPIVVIDIDTLRADHLGCYGYHRKTSPQIDALARESLLFELAFGQAPNTAPSQASIFTGRYPSSHGLIRLEDRLPTEVTTLAESLAAAGYRTAAFVDGGFLGRQFGFAQGFETFDDVGGGLDVIGPKASAWLREHREENFFLLVHTYDVHTPYSPPQPYRSLFLDGLDAPSPGFEPSVEQMEAVRLSVWTGEPRSLPPNDLAHAMALYDGGIRWVDTWVGGFLEQMRRFGLLERAIVVLLSDHGEEFQEHGSVLHEKLYSTVTRIPLLIRLPGGEEARPVPDITESIDVMPTLLDLVGVPPPPRLQGESLRRLLEGRDDGPFVAFSESPFFGHRRAVTLGEYRLLFTLRRAKTELYRFRVDPLEQTDLVELHPREASRLKQALGSWQRSVMRHPSPAREKAQLDRETRRQLKALGYLR